MASSSMTAAMRRFKFNRCPVCDNVYRTHKLNEHIRAVHPTLSEQERNFKSAQQIKKEALLICSKDFDYKNFHDISKTQRHQFVRAHAHHNAKNKKLTRADKRTMKQLFYVNFNHPVDIDQSSIHSQDTIDQLLNEESQENGMASNQFVSRPLDESSNQIQPQANNEVEQPLVIDETRNLFELQPVDQAELTRNLFDLIQDASSTQMDSSLLRQMLFVDDVVPDALQTQYIECYLPGTNEILFHQMSEESNAPPIDETTTPTKSVDTQTQTADDNKEAILMNSFDYIQSLNSLKNTMIAQLLKDNIAMSEARLQSRKKALEEMEKLFDNQMEATTHGSFDQTTMSLFASMFQLKEDIIRRLMSENVSTHPSLYHLQQLLTELK